MKERKRVDREETCKEENSREKSDKTQNDRGKRYQSRNGKWITMAKLLCSLILLSGLAACGKITEEAQNQKSTVQLETETATQEVTMTGKEIKVQELTARLESGVISQDISITEEDIAAWTDFGVRLFCESLKEGENTLISPLSAAVVLGMAANGAQGETLSQMEGTMGMPIERFNAALYYYRKNLPQGEQYQVRLADSVWLKEDDSLTVKEDFLKKVAGWYEAEVFWADFGDDTIAAVNTWVSEHTEGRIQKLLSQIQPEAVMYLVNTLTFDAQWENIYYDHQIREDIFTKEDGTKQTAEFMYAEEAGYLEDKQATGFLKYYADGKYAFAALLPKEGISLADYVSSFTGEKVRQLLVAVQEDVKVRTAIPRFQDECSIGLGEVLKAMGMELAFDVNQADFSGMGVYKDGRLFISQVLHKTFINVDTRGTQAGAATLMEVAAGASPMEPEKVYLNRPFVYMILDCETKTPLFIGAVTDLE